MRLVSKRSLGRLAAFGLPLPFRPESLRQPGRHGLGDGGRLLRQRGGCATKWPRPGREDSRSTAIPRTSTWDSAAKGKPARGNHISGNHIHHTGLIWKHGNPICLNSAEHNVVSHNLIHDVPRMGILATRDSGGNLIEFNEVRRVNLETGDSGGIYLYWVTGQPDPNVIRDNLVVDSIGMGTTHEGKILSPHYAWGIYLDGETGNTVVRDNIVVGNVLGGVFFNGGRKNVVENNILMAVPGAR